MWVTPIGFPELPATKPFIGFVNPITEQGGSSSHQGNTENNDGGYSPDCFCSSSNYPRSFSLSAGRVTKSAAICRAVVIISIHFNVLPIVYFHYSCMRPGLRRVHITE